MLRSVTAAAWAVLAVGFVAAPAEPAGAMPASPAAADPTDDTPWAVPTRPPACTGDEFERGELRGCVLEGRGSPSERGWGTPILPSGNSDYVFNGWTYSGPPEVAWAREFITANTATVASSRPGGLRTHVAAAALFEGFLAAIEADGYDVTSAGAYAFRCTSGTGGNCTSGSMSNHAWGLAVDVNPGANPERTYFADGETSACAIPQMTDFPKWVVDTAQEWGLSWGGYGYLSGGCYDSANWSDSVRRDPHHFEFRGTVEQALTIAAQHGVAQRPMFCTDAVTDGGRDATSCNLLGRPGARWRTPVPIDPPEGANAVLLNVTATAATGDGYLTVESCDETEAGDRATSNVNFAAGTDTANLALVRLAGDEQRLCVYRSAAVHTLADAAGYIADRGSNAEARLYTPETPRRVHDSRTDGHCSESGCTPGAVPAGSQDHTGAAGAIVANVTATEPLANGFLSAGRCNALTGPPEYSTVNYSPATSSANSAIVDTGDTNLCLYTSATTHTIVDVTGTLDLETGDGITPIVARRALDTRACTDGWCDGRVPAGQVIAIPGVISHSGAVINITVTGATEAGFVTVDDCARLVSGVEPTTSTVNHAAGATVANLAFVASSGELCAYTHAAAHLIVDVQANIAADSDDGIVTVAPVRYADTRA